MGKTPLIKITSILLFILTVSACAQLTVVNVNAITDTKTTATGQRYFLTDASNTTNNDLYFQEFRRYFDYILQKQGYIRVDSPNDADIEIHFRYGVSDGRTALQTYSWPIYETFGGDSYTVTEKITDSSNKTSTIKRTVYMPPYVRQIGSSVETSAYTVFNRFASLVAYSTKNSEHKEKPLWSVDINSVGDSNDLRAVMPYLATASSPYLGKNSVRQQSVTIKEDNPVLMEMRSLHK